jgi:hypothetical protein
MRWRSAFLTASSCVLLAGCGGERLPVLTAVRLSEARDCRALVQAAIAAVNRHEIPPALQEQTLSAANACRRRELRP